MAQFQLKGMNELVQKLSGLGSVEEIAPQMLKEAAPILQKAMVKKAEPHKDTGAMASSIKPTEPTRGNRGYEIVVRPTGKDKKGVRNMEKMIHLEYGTSRQPATPVVLPAVKEAESEVVKKMTEVFEREILS